MSTHFILKLILIPRRAFSSSPIHLHPGFLDLSARATIRENNYFQQASGTPHIEHSPALQLLRSESELGQERPNLSNQPKPESPLQTPGICQRTTDQHDEEKGHRKISSSHVAYINRIDSLNRQVQGLINARKNDKRQHEAEIIKWQKRVIKESTTLFVALVGGLLLPLCYFYKERNKYFSLPVWREKDKREARKEEKIVEEPMRRLECSPAEGTPSGWKGWLWSSGVDDR